MSFMSAMKSCGEAITPSSIFLLTVLRHHSRASTDPKKVERGRLPTSEQSVSNGGAVWPSVCRHWRAEGAVQVASQGSVLADEKELAPQLAPKSTCALQAGRHARVPWWQVRTDPRSMGLVITVW